MRLAFFVTGDVILTPCGERGEFVGSRHGRFVAESARCVSKDGASTGLTIGNPPAGRLVERPSRAQGDSEPTPTPPRRGPDKAPLLGGVGVGRFIERKEDSAARLSSFSRGQLFHWVLKFILTA